MDCVFRITIWANNLECDHIYKKNLAYSYRSLTILVMQVSEQSFHKLATGNEASSQRWLQLLEYNNQPSISSSI
jgi:hypothetical protein